MIDRTLRGWHVREYLRGFPLDQVGVEYLVDWIDVNPAERAYLVADILGTPVGRVAELHALLLEHYAHYGIGDVFSARFSSGSYSEAGSEWMKNKIETAKHWTTDERPAVREWADNLVLSLYRSLRAYEAVEAEATLIA